MFGRLGWMEILVIVVLVLILFSHNKIPAMMKNVADGLKVFKKELKSENTKSANAPAKSKPVAKRTTTAKKSAAKSVKKNDKSSAPEIVYVEFGAYASMASAHAAQRRLLAAHADLFDGHEFVVLEQGTKSPFKLRIAFDDMASAKEFVESATNIKCKVVA